MVSRSFAAVLLLAAVLAGGLAMGAPTPRGGLDWRDRGKPELQLDRADLFRPAQVAECGAVRRENVGARREQKRDPRGQRKAAARYGCDATWSN